MKREIGYADEVMSGFEYSAAGLMVSCGLLREAFTVLRAAADRYDGRLRTGLSGADRPDHTAWGYSGNPFGDDECGKFYARAMSIWSVLTACQGFEHDNPAGVIAFAPVWQPADHVSFFSAAEGWGLFRQTREAEKQCGSIEMKWGRLQIRTLKLVVAEGSRPRNVLVTLSGGTIPASHTSSGNQVHINLRPPVVLTAGQTIKIVLE
jgi:hypothetical protein